jgi:dTDP-4-dehydrorhamnose reductase
VTKIAVLGASGMLGRDVLSVLDGHETHGFLRSDFDITNESAVPESLGNFDVVINCAAYTQVDDAESSPERAFAVNSQGPRNIARALAGTQSKFIHISTDYVFDGTASAPYEENHPTNPVSVYGASKQQGEIAIMEENPQNSSIVRTSWLYGEHGSSFPKSILTAGLTRETIDVVDDQQGQPTWTLDVAQQIKLLIDAGIPSGIFHATNSGQTTWFELAQSLFRLAGWDVDRVKRATSNDFPRAAARPAFSVLSHSGWQRRNLASPRPWEVALDDAWSAFLSSIANPEVSP